MSFRDKALEIVPDDIVSVAVGRGWKRARVLKLLSDNRLIVRFKDGRKREISADHVLTEDEKATFKKAQGQTTIVRSENETQRDTTSIERNEDDPSQDYVDKSEKTKNGIFSKLF